MKDVQANQTDDEAEDTTSHVSRAIARSTNSAPPKAQAKTNSFDLKLDKLTNCGDDTNIDLAFSKCAQTHSLITKHTMEMRKLTANLKKTKLLDQDRLKESDEFVSTLQKHLNILDKVVVDRKGSMKSLQGILTAAGKTCKKSQKLLLEMKAMSKSKP